MSTHHHEPVAAPETPRALGKEIATAFVIALLGSIVITRVASAPPLDEYVHVAVATLLLWTALRFAQRDTRGLSHYGLAMAGLMEPSASAPQRSVLQEIPLALPVLARELTAALLLAVIVFPPFVFGFYWWHQPERAFELVVPPDLGSFVLAQVLVVGLPEEAMFRGYLQTRLADLLPHSVMVAGQKLPWLAIVVQALLFAVLHFAVDLNVARLAVLFPALLFGVVRSVRGGIGAAVFFHALCNLCSDVLVRGWL